MHCTTLYNFFFQNIVYPSVFCCFSFYILQNPVHLVSALRLDDILIIGEKRREERERDRWTTEEGRGEEKRREDKRKKEKRREEKRREVVLSEDAALHTLALFCPEPQSLTQQNLCCLSASRRDRSPSAGCPGQRPRRRG